MDSVLVVTLHSVTTADNKNQLYFGLFTHSTAHRLQVHVYLCNFPMSVFSARI